MLSVFAPRFTPIGQKTAWQHAVVQADLPFPTKGLLLILATEWMDAHGGSCFPNEQQIMEKAGVSRPCLTRHLRIAEERGFIRRWRYGRGNRNRRYNYQATLPEVSIGNEVSYPGGLIGNEVAEHEPCPRVNQNQERAATPEPVSVPPSGALSVPSLRQAKTGVPDTLPESWLEQARIQRPDLTTDTIAKSAGIFINHHRAKGTVMVDWRAAFRVWMARERAAPQPASRYPRPNAKEQPVSAEVQASWDYSEQRRLEQLRAAGIDPATGFPVTTPPPVATARPAFQQRLVELALAGVPLAEAKRLALAG